MDCGRIHFSDDSGCDQLINERVSLWLKVASNRVWFGVVRLSSFFERKRNFVARVRSGVVFVLADCVFVRVIHFINEGAFLWVIGFNFYVALCETSFEF